MSKYRIGDKLDSLDSLMLEDVVYIWGKIKNKAWYQNYSICILHTWLYMGGLRKAIKTEEEK